MKHACDTCRFFQQSGKDRMGWCNHPRRKTGSDVKLYVRAGELPCRDDWAHDLWLPIDASVDLAAATLTPSDKVAAATPEQLNIVASLERVSEQRVERVSAEDVVVTTSVRSAPRPDLVDREGVRKAREKIQLLNKGLRATDDGSPSNRVQDAEFGERESWRASRRVVAGEEVAPVRLEEMPRPFPEITAYPDDDARFSTVPELRDDVELPTAAPRARQSVVRESEPDDELSIFDDIPNPVVHRQQPTPTNHLPASVSAPPGNVASVTGQRRDVMSAEPPSETLLAAVTPVAERHVAEVVPSEAPRRPTRPAIELAAAIRGESLARTGVIDRAPMRPSQQQARVPSTREVIDYVGATSAGERAVRASEPVSELPSGAHDREHVADLRLAHPTSAELGSTAPVHIWASTAVECRTCKDFRPSEAGDRGWCTNPWAFTHRRVVEAEDLPCETSIGNWWLPSDTNWLDGADISAHGSPTPLLDQWLRRRGQPSEQSDAAPQRRRRRG